MSVFKIHYFLFLAVFMLAAKPFVGFHAVKNFPERKIPGVLVKAFTKRKQEYVENSPFDASTIQKRLADPLVALTVLFAGFLALLFPARFKKDNQLTTSLLEAIHLNLFPPLPCYLLSGKLII